MFARLVDAPQALRWSCYGSWCCEGIEIAWQDRVAAVKITTQNLPVEPWGMQESGEEVRQAQSVEENTKACNKLWLFFHKTC